MRDFEKMREYIDILEDNSKIIETTECKPIEKEVLRTALNCQISSIQDNLLSAVNLSNAYYNKFD